MKRKLSFTGRALLGIAAAGAVGLAMSVPAAAQDKVVIGIPTFLTGGAAPPFGVPARNGAELMIQAINAGKLPAPYSAKGMAGRSVEAIIYDESGGSTKQVAEFRNKIQKQNVDLFAGFTSSGTCAAITRVAEELKTLTIYSTCGTPRVFEELDPNPKYVFRTMSHATADNVAAAHYAAKSLGGVKGYTGINQNYAWGQDSFRDFDLAMKVLSSGSKVSDKLQWPKLFSGQYGTEISALLLGKEELIHTSFWGGDLEAFIFQALPRGLFRKKKVLLTVAGTAVYRLGKKMPEGMILGSRGPYGIYAANVDTPLNNWFRKAYFNRFNNQPTGPSYQYAQAVLAAKIAYDKAAAANGGKFPNTDQVIAALEGLEFESMSTKVRMALNKGHQAITDHVYGITKWDKKTDGPVMTNVQRFNAECVMPPDGVKSVAWIKGGMKGAKC